MQPLTDKPSRPIFDGTYRLTRDGYIIRAVRSGTLLEGLAMRPSLEYGKLVYRITVEGAPVSVRAYMLVREVWGVPMQDPGPFVEMRRGIDAHNKQIRKDNQLRRKETKKKEISLQLCPYCKINSMRPHPNAQTCGEAACAAEHKRVSERARKLRAKEREKAASEKKEDVSEVTRQADIDRVVSTAPCYWRGFFDDKSKWVEPVKTNVPGYDWDDPIMGIAWDYGVGVEWVMTYEYWRCAA